MIELKLKTQKIAHDGNGRRFWQVHEHAASYAPSELALIIVDMWDKHWSTGATRRCGVLAEKIDELTKAMRGAGSLIIHAPSDTLDFYKDSLARKRALDIEIVKPDKEVEVADYPQPIDASDGGSDTKDDFAPNTHVWTRQTDKIFIDETKDIISDEGDVVYSHLRKRGVKLVVYVGVHTNMCVLGRSFAIREMLRRGVNVALARDLTDAMYNPEKPPYVSHDDGTALVVSYIEKFYCPSLLGADLLRQIK